MKGANPWIKFATMLSVTRWLVYLFNFWPFTTMKLHVDSKKFLPKDVHFFAKYLNTPSKICQRLLGIW